MHVRMVCGSLLLTKSAGLSEASEGRRGRGAAGGRGFAVSAASSPRNEHQKASLAGGRRQHPETKECGPRISATSLKRKELQLADADRPAGADA